VGTRNILFQPELVTDTMADMLASYKSINYENPSQSKNISIGASLNHVDELSPQVVKAIERLTKKGLTVRGQSVLMKGINDNVKTVQELMETFLAIGIVPYYLLHCMPVVGTKHLRTSVQKGIDIIRELSARSGTTAPNYIYVTPIGKHRIGTEHRLQHVIIDGQKYIRATTQYKAADFLRFADKKELPPLHEVNAEGYVVSHYLDGHDEEEKL
jgi:lysine 2,3-aminomutase